MQSELYLYLTAPCVTLKYQTNVVIPLVNPSFALHVLASGPVLTKAYNRRPLRVEENIPCLYFQPTSLCPCRALTVTASVDTAVGT